MIFCSNAWPTELGGGQPEAGAAPRPAGRPARVGRPASIMVAPLSRCLEDAAQLSNVVAYLQK